jgi:putative toxin-antitoxin system antitoxin component (TIGR02293 family)
MWHNVERGARVAANPNISEFIGITPRSEFDLAEIVERGLPLSSIDSLKERGLTFSEVAELVISPRTLKHRKARSENLSHEETDRLVRVARVVALAENTFGNSQKALLWLRAPDDRIGDRSPLSMLLTESGGRLVENMLWQIDEGIYT